MTEKIKPIASELGNTYNAIIAQLKLGSKKRNQVVTDLERTLGHHPNAIRNAIKDLVDNQYVQIQELTGNGAILVLNSEFHGDTVNLVDGELKSLL